jgi:hypothetical protein
MCTMNVEHRESQYTRQITAAGTQMRTRIRFQ